VHAGTCKEPNAHAVGFQAHSRAPCVAVVTCPSHPPPPPCNPLAAPGALRSDVPIRFSKKLRQKLIAASKFKGLADVPKFLKGLSLKDLAPEAPAIAEFSTGEVMGHSRWMGWVHRVAGGGSIR
jgi:hypothetical protein